MSCVSLLGQHHRIKPHLIYPRFLIFHQVVLSQYLNYLYIIQKYKEYPDIQVWSEGHQTIIEKHSELGKFFTFLVDQVFPNREKNNIKRIPPLHELNDIQKEAFYVLGTSIILLGLGIIERIFPCEFSPSVEEWSKKELQLQNFTKSSDFFYSQHQREKDLLYKIIELCMDTKDKKHHFILFGDIHIHPISNVLKQHMNLKKPIHVLQLLLQYGDNEFYRNAITNKGYTEKKLMYLAPFYCKSNVGKIIEKGTCS